MGDVQEAMGRYYTENVFANAPAVLGFDVAEFITHPSDMMHQDRESFWREWGIDLNLEARGGIENIEPQITPSPREVYLLQRKSTKVGNGLGKTTGWIHRTTLKNKGVKMISGVEYLKIDNEGLHVRINDGLPQVLPVDNIIVCAGQESNTDLYTALVQKNLPVHLIGGALEAAELDAKRAIRQGTELALAI